MKMKILSRKFVSILLFLLLATPISANEGIRAFQFNKHIRQAGQLKLSQDYQRASEALQKARNTLGSTLILKSLKKAEMERLENEIEEIKKLADEKIKGATINDSPIATPSPTSTPKRSSLSPTPAPTVATTPTGIDWEQFNRELNEKLKEVRDIDNDNSNESPEPTMSIEQQKAAKIVSISDSLGNIHETNCWWSTTHYECPPKEQKEPTVSIRTTPQLTFTINAQDSNNRPLTYHYYYAEGCRIDGSNWITSNTCTSTLRTNQLGLRTFIFYVKNDDNYGSVGLDANTTLRYRIIE